MVASSLGCLYIHGLGGLFINNLTAKKKSSLLINYSQAKSFSAKTKLSIIVLQCKVNKYYNKVKFQVLWPIRSLSRSRYFWIQIDLPGVTRNKVKGSI